MRGERVPTGRALPGGNLRDLPEPEQAAYAWRPDHFNAERHEHSDRISLSRVPARTTTIRRMGKAARPTARA